MFAPTGLWDAGFNRRGDHSQTQNSSVWYHRWERRVGTTDATNNAKRFLLFLCLSASLLLKLHNCSMPNAIPACHVLSFQVWTIRAYCCPNDCGQERSEEVQPYTRYLPCLFAFLSCFLIDLFFLGLCYHFTLHHIIFHWFLHHFRNNDVFGWVKPFGNKYCKWMVFYQYGRTSDSSAWALARRHFLPNHLVPSERRWLLSQPCRCPSRLSGYLETDCLLVRLKHTWIPFPSFHFLIPIPFFLHRPLPTCVL